MSKWISGFPPLREGNYLTRWHNHVAFSGFYYKRCNYYPKSKTWLTYDKLKYDPYRYSSVTFEWWDEFGITENKIVKKLKF